MNDANPSQHASPAPSRGLDLGTLRAGDLVEVRRAEIGDIVIGDTWVPAVVGEDEASIEIDMPGGARPGTRAGAPLAARVDELRRQSAEIRRASTVESSSSTPQR